MNVNENESTPPADTTVVVEEGFNNVTSQFYAHSFVLSNYSGYFKTWLHHQNNNNAAELSSSRVIKISAIRAEIFAALLTFMYTGVLDLNYANVYEILLAANLLHVPTVLEICKSYLTTSINNHHHHQNLVSATTTTTIEEHLPSLRQQIIKPIPMKQPITIYDRSRILQST